MKTLEGVSQSIDFGGAKAALHLTFKDESTRDIPLPSHEVPSSNLNIDLKTLVRADIYAYRSPDKVDPLLRKFWSGGAYLAKAHVEREVRNTQKGYQ